MTSELKPNPSDGSWQPYCPGRRLWDGERMDAASGAGRGGWGAWVAGLVGAVALAETFLLGTLGWFGAAFAIGTTCTDDFSCGSSSCAPCAGAHAWVTVGWIGQWVLFAAAVTILVLGTQRAGWRRAATIAACALIPLAAAWFAISTAVAQRSF
jgi:hypothetical protein